MRNKKDMYDVKSYSDEELYSLLDLTGNPTDRELEAKILFYIRRYENMQKDEGDKLAHFFQQIYEHFFQIGDDENEKVVEGFETIDTASTPADEPKKQDGILITNNLAFAPDDLRLNPLLKQTIQKTVTIDSQYRDNANGTMTTDYTFNLQEVLKDVVSLKLYAVQIPYTWYTISAAYGSNFFYLKSNTPGINTGIHDYKVEISAGNYNEKTLPVAINDSILALHSKYPDVSFGSTGLYYDVNACTSKLTIDIQKVYNDDNYYFSFGGQFYSPEPTENNINRNKNLASFLGFNYSNYTMNTIYSDRTCSQIIDGVTSQYSFDNSNNTIILYHYVNPINAINDGFSSNSTIIETIPITFPVTTTPISQQLIYQSVKTVLNSLSSNPNSQIVNSDISFSQINTTDICGNQINNYGRGYFYITANTNRNTTQNTINSKLALVFPSETTSLYPIWIGQNSCFKFTNVTNELNTLVSETDTVYSQYKVVEGMYIYLQCNNPSYNVSNINDLSATIQPNSYSLNTFITQIQTSLNNLSSPTNITNPSIHISTNAFINAQSRFDLTLDINKFLYTENFRIDLSGTLFDSVLGFTNNTKTQPLYNNYVFLSTKPLTSSFTLYNTNRHIMTVYVDSSNSNLNGIKSDVSYNIDLSFSGSQTYTVKQLVDTVNGLFQNYADETTDKFISNPMKNSFLTVQSNAESLIFTLHINIQRILTEKNYSLYFVDSSSNSDHITWASSLNVSGTNPIDISGSDPIDISGYPYILYDQSIANQSYAEIIGNGTVTSDNLQLLEPATLTLNALPNADGVYIPGGGGNITFTIPTGNYSRIQIYNRLNADFSNNPVTNGTIIDYVTQNTVEYARIRWNINKVYTTKDYNLVFYDLNSFVYCYLGNTSYRNATWDTTLGWLMGFRSLTTYSLLPTNIYTSGANNNTYFYDPATNNQTNNKYTYDTTNNIVIITGDTTLSINLYNYFLILLDDYNQNHLNDGLITLIQKDNNLSLPSYANRAKYICDPATGQLTNTGVTDSYKNNLTQNQIYSINQIINTQNTPSSINVTGPYVKDVFGLIPLKTTGLNPGANYVEFGGTLQAQDRVYFGPVNISRIGIKLVNDKGDVVDLNRNDWSIQLIAEQLYRSPASQSKPK